VTTQSPTERSQSLNQVVILFSKFFLRDRKNGLASMKAFPEEVHGLFLHLQLLHLSASYSFSSGRRLFWLETKKYLHRHPVDS